MRSPETVTLTTAPSEYDSFNEQSLRRQIEIAFQDLRGDVIEVRDKTDKVASLAMRRHQFLLMGA